MNRHFILVGAIVFAMAFFAGTRRTLAASWFVATNGNDATGTGSMGAPFRSLIYALSQVSSGDVIEVRGGTYREAGRVRFRRPGITMRSYTGEWASITAPLDNETDYSSCFQIDPDADHTTLSRLEISGGYYYGVMLQTKWDWGDPADRMGAGQVTLEDCVIHDTGRDCIKITPNCDDTTIRRCEIYRSGVGPANVTAGNAEGIDNVNGDRMRVQDCEIHDIYSTGVYFKGGATDGIVERTRIRGCGAGGVLIGFDTSPEYFDTDANPGYYENIRGTVRNCLILDTGWEGIGMYAASNPAVFNNTLVNVCTGNVHAALYFGLTYQDWAAHPGRPSSVNPTLLNNLVAQPEGFSDEMFEIRYSGDLGGMSALAGWPEMDHNGYSIAGGGTAKFTDNRPGLELYQGTLSRWRTHAGTDAHSLASDPLFADPATTNLDLQAISPYIDMGTNAAWMASATDLAGAVRIANAIVDAGAYEYAGAGMAGRIVGHADVAGATNLPANVIAKLAMLRWFFTHASVGGNLITGMNALHEGDPARYPLAIYDYDGQNGDGDYHGAVATEGDEGAADYRASSLPDATTNGIIYECMRGNPDWQNKLTCFSNSVVQSGWRFPKVNVVMDKFCWIDPYADPTQYGATMSGLEERHPQTLFVYATLPLTTETAGSENDNRNEYNRAVRAFCTANGKWLLDVADLEAWSPDGVEQTYLSSSFTNQLMDSAYATGPDGGDYHLNSAGRRQTALGWYALAGALFATDRDRDGMSDGDELIAGTSPTDAESAWTVQSCEVVATNAVGLQWNMITGRVYAIEKCTSLVSSNWSTAVGGLTGTGLYSYATSSLSADAAYYRIGATQ